MSSLPVYQPVAAKPAAYSTPVLLRFAWQQTRKIWPFAAGVAVLAVVFLALLAPLQDRSALPIGGTVAAGLVGVLVVIGGSIVAFSVEREEQTIHYLRTLPRHWLALYLGKVGATLGCSLAATAGVLLLAGPITGAAPQVDAEIVTQFVAFLAEALAWATLVSLLCPIPILATILACGAISVSQQLTILLVDDRSLGYLTAEYSETTPWRLIVAGAVLLIDAPLVYRWLAGQRRRSGGLELRPPREVDDVPTTTQPNRASVRLRTSLPRLAVSGPTTGAMTGRLVWQTLRDAWPWTVLTVIMACGLAGSLEWAAYQMMHDDLAVTNPPIATVLMIAALCGALTFHGDQRESKYRYLATHACRPAVLWRVRVLLWAVPVGFVLLAFVVISSVEAWANTFRGVTQIAQDRLAALEARQLFEEMLRYGLLQSILAAAAAFAVGQLASIVIGSGILAVGFSLLGAALILSSTYLSVWWQLPPVWCYLPVIVGCLVATRLRTKDWLTERKSLGGWARVGLAVVVPIVVVAGSLPLVRLAQIDRAERQVGVDTEMSWRAAIADYHQQMVGAEDVGRQYRELFYDITSAMSADQHDGGQHAYEDVEPAFIERLLEMTNASDALPASFDSSDRVIQLLGVGFDRALDEGDLEKAFSYALALRRFRHLAFAGAGYVGVSWPEALLDSWLVRWATAPGQTSARILESLSQLEKVDEYFPHPQFIVINDYLLFRQVLQGERTDLIFTNREDAALAFAAHKLPWERRRALRALDVLASLTHDYVAGIVETNRRMGSLWPFDSPRPMVRIYDSGPTKTRPPRTIRLHYDADRTARTSPLVDLLWPDRWEVDSPLTYYFQKRTTLHATRMRLGLIAYYWDHGEYPESIEDLPPAYSPRPPTSHHDATIRYSLIGPTAEQLNEPLHKRFGGEGVVLLEAPATSKMPGQLDYWLQAEANDSRSVIALQLPAAEAFQAPPNDK